MSLVTTMISLSGSEASKSFQVLNSPENIFTISSFVKLSLTVNTGLLGFTPNVKASIPTLNSLSSGSWSFSVSLTVLATIPKSLVLSITDFTPCPDPPAETYIEIFSSGNEESTLSQVTLPSIKLVEIDAITGARVDEPLNNICGTNPFSSTTGASVGAAAHPANTSIKTKIIPKTFNFFIYTPHVLILLKIFHPINNIT